MTSRRRVLLGLATAAAAIALVASGWRWAHPLPTLAEAAALAEAHQYEDAEGLVSVILRGDPTRGDARLLAAQLALDRPGPPTPPGRRPDPKPAAEALEHLKHVRAGDPHLLATAALNRGRAEYRLGRLDDAETSWLEALRLEPTVPEAGWYLLETYYLQGRSDDARRLALRLHEVETDPRDRVQYLLELVRQDAQPPAPASIVQWFEPVVRQSPGGLRANLALGLALVHAGEGERGLDVLRRAVKDHPDRPDAWDAWLTGLDDAGDIDTLARAVERLPSPLAGTDRFAKHRARAAQERGDWHAAASGYRRAAAHAPHDHRLEYRLSRALRNAGDVAEADRFDAAHRAYVAASGEVRSLYDHANADKTLGVDPHPDLYRRVARLRDRMGLGEEAAAWRRLASPPEAATDNRLVGGVK